MLRKRIVGFVALPSILGVIAALLLVETPVAQAATVDLSCTGWQTTNYDPGVTVTPREVHITSDGILASCVSADPTLLSGTYHDDVQGVVDCAFGTVQGVREIHWNNGQTTKIAFTTALDAKPNGETVVVEHGTITDGEFRGDTTLTTITLAHTALIACFTPQGVTSTAGPVTSTYTSA